MSAFVVEKELIDFLLTFMSSARGREVFIASKTEWVRNWWDVVEDGKPGRQIDRIGQILHSENVRSVNYRYGEEHEPDRYRFAEHNAALTLQGVPLAVQVFKSVACLDYQSCETPDWKDTDARRILEDINDAARRSLPGYEAAKWGAPEKSERKIMSLTAMMAGRTER